MSCLESLLKAGLASLPGCRPDNVPGEDPLLVLVGMLTGPDGGRAGCEARLRG